MSINNENEYFIIVNEILDKIYNLSNEENEKITGTKNKEQPYELKIKNILDTHCIEKIEKINKDENIDKNKKYKYNNLFYEYQPNGSQLPPDFIIYYEKINSEPIIICNKIKIECKSSKNNKPVWNCSIPDEDTIYVYYDTQKKLVYIFYGDEIITKEKKLEIIKFNNELKKLCNEFNKTTLCDTNINYYPRQMMNQIKKMDKIIVDRDKTFSNVKTKLLDKKN